VDRTQVGADQIMNVLSMNSLIKPKPQDLQVPQHSEYDALTA